MPRAVWRGTVLGAAERTRVVEGNHYPRPWPLARRLKCYVAFGPTVTVQEEG